MSKNEVSAVTSDDLMATAKRLEADGVLQALYLTCEVCGGTDLSQRVIAVYLEKLAPYQSAAILDALDRCQKELEGRLSIAAILKRLDQVVFIGAWGQFRDAIRDGVMPADQRVAEAIKALGGLRRLGDMTTDAAARLRPDFEALMRSNHAAR